MIKLIAFDWNGTLLDDARVQYGASQFVNKHFDKKSISFKKWQSIYITPIIKIYLARGFSKNEFINNRSRISRLYHNYYEKRARKIKSRKGAESLLKWLKDNKIESIIFSNHTLLGINTQLKRLGIKKYITKVLAHAEKDEAATEKKKEARLISHIKSADLKKSEVLIIGDTIEEMQIGRGAGIKTVAITGGFLTEKRLKTAKPNFIIHNLIGLKGIIGKLNK